MKCTLVSLLPFGFYNKVPGLYPGEFRIPAAGKDDFELLIIDAAVHYVYIDATRGSIPIRINSEELATSLVNDYKQSCLAMNENSYPGLFWLPGELKKSAIVKDFASEIESAIKHQRSWFVSLVRMADDDWEKSHQHKFISDLQRYACKDLGYERQWVVEIPKAKLLCEACGSIVTGNAIICPTCKHIIDADKYAKLKFAS